MKIGTRSISRMLIFIPTLRFWIPNPNSIFEQTWAEKFRVVRFARKLAHIISLGCWFLLRHYFSEILTLVSRMLIFILTLFFWHSKPKSLFWANLSWKSQIVYFAWKLTHRISGGCDSQDTEEGSEAKTKMNNCIKCLSLIFLSKVKVKIEAISGRILDKWDYSYNKKSFTSKTFCFNQTLKQNQKYI